MRIDLKDPFTIGRSEENDLVVADAAVSREHAILKRVNQGWMVEDLSSRHGTLHNNKQLNQRVTLNPNDELSFGHSRFLFNSEFDLQNAAFSDKSVFLASPSDETIETAPVSTLSARQNSSSSESVKNDPADELDFLAHLADLFESPSNALAEILHRSCAQVRQLFRADRVLLMLWDSAAGELRATVVDSDSEQVLADSSLLKQTFTEQKSLLVSDRPDLAPHPAPGSPPVPACRSVITSPLLVGDACLGVLYLEREELDAYSLLDLRRIRAVARLVALFLDNRQQMNARELRAKYEFAESEIQWRSSIMKTVLDMANRVAQSPTTVLITGETGTGKELMAKEIHRLSEAGNNGGPFMAINCSAIPEQLFESLLFGHEKGAFTGADRLQQGYIEQAHGGTIFLDEIGEMSPMVQPKLLRFLQEKSFTRVGGSRQLRANTRIICATNRTLLDEVKAGKFREDLYHRISVFEVPLPPLRKRREDISMITDFLIQKHSSAMNREILGISPDAMIQLEKYSWPGNIRELGNCVERAVLLCDGKVLLPQHFNFKPPSSSPNSDSSPEIRISFGEQTENFRPLEEVEKEYILKVLEAEGWRQNQAAEVLGVHRNTLSRKIKEYELSKT